MARRTNKRQLKEAPPTVIGAGITEQWYFKHLNNNGIVKVKIRPRLFGRENVASLEKRIEQVMREDGKAIVVFDADVTAWNESERRSLESLHKRYASNSAVELYASMPSIEYWFLLHYIATNRFFGTSENVIKELRKHISGFDKSETFLRNEKWVADMEAGGQRQKAISRASKFGRQGDSWSDLWRLFEK